MGQGEGTRGRVRIEQGRKRVRAYRSGHLVADSEGPWLVWERPYYPTYYFPRSDVMAEMTLSGATEHSPSRGTGTLYDLRVEGSRAAAAACVYEDSPIAELRSLVRIRWEAMDEWLEEDEPVYTHPRDPYSRIDILASSKRVQVTVDGVKVADSDQPRILSKRGSRLGTTCPSLTCAPICCVRPTR